MALPVFPSISEYPEVSLYNEGMVIDPVIKNPTTAGYTQTRARFTRIRERWSVGYGFISRASKELIKTFERETVFVGALAFEWTNPEDSVTYVVRFAGPVEYEPYTSGQGIHMMDASIKNWIVRFILEEV